MPNKWVDYVKRWAKKNNMSYGCALTDPQLKIDYRKSSTTTKQERDMMGGEDRDAPEKKKSTEKLEAKEREMMGAEDRDAPEEEIVVNYTPKKKKKREPKKKEPKKKETPQGVAAEKVLTNPDLVKYIKAFTPGEKITETELTKLTEDINTDVLFWSNLMYIFESDFVKFKNKTQKNKIFKAYEKYRGLVDDMFRLLQQRLEYLAKKSDLDVNDDLLYEDDYISNEDYYYRLDIDGDGNIGKDTAENIEDAALNSFRNYKEIMEEMGITQKDAVTILNKRINKRKDNKIQFKVPK
jgi:hypothetical protein